MPFKTFTIKGIYGGLEDKEPVVKTGTLKELKSFFNHTLESGKSCEHVRGNYKINTDPPKIKTLVSMLNKAEHNVGRSVQEWYYELV